MGTGARTGQGRAGELAARLRRSARTSAFESVHEARCARSQEPDPQPTLSHLPGRLRRAVRSGRADVSIGGTQPPIARVVFAGNAFAFLRSAILWATARVCSAGARPLASTAAAAAPR